MRASDIMTANPRTATPIDTVRRAAGIMRELNVGAVPVVEGASSQMLRGIITDRDIAMRCTAQGHAPHCSVRDHMTSAPLKTVGPDDDVEHVIEVMERAQVRRIPVVNRSGELLGIIAQADVATRFGQQHPREVEELLERVSSPAARTT